MSVLGAQQFQKSDRVRVGLNPLPRTVCHVDDRCPVPGNDVHPGAPGNEVEDHGIVPARSRVVERGEPTGES